MIKMATKLKSDVINYGDYSIRIDYLKVKKGDGKIYTEIALVGKDAKTIDKNTNYQFTNRFYGSKEHARRIALKPLKHAMHKLARGTVEMDYDEVMSLPSDLSYETKIYVTALGQENIYFQRGGLNYFVKSSKNFKRFDTPKWIKTQELKEML